MGSSGPNPIISQGASTLTRNQRSHFSSAIYLSLYNLGKSFRLHCQFTHCFACKESGNQREHPAREAGPAIHEGLGLCVYSSSSACANLTIQSGPRGSERKREAGSGKREAGSGKREAGSGKREAGSGKREAGSGKRAACAAVPRPTPLGAQLRPRGGPERPRASSGRGLTAAACRRPGPAAEPEGRTGGCREQAAAARPLRLLSRWRGKSRGREDSQQRPRVESLQVAPKPSLSR
ncbi:uncharacterized protein LOC144336326 [Macaca mulatta]